MYKVKNKLAPTITANIFGKITENHHIISEAITITMVLIASPI